MSARGSSDTVGDLFFWVKRGVRSCTTDEQPINGMNDDQDGYGYKTVTDNVMSINCVYAQF